MNIAEWSIGRKILVGAAIVVVLVVVLIVVLRPNVTTRAFRGQQTGTVELVDSSGQTITLEVRNVGSDVNVRGVKASSLRGEIFFASTAFPRAAAYDFESGELPVEVVFFAPDGELAEVHQVPAKTKVSLTPEQQYQYTIVAPQGLLAERGVPVDESSSLSLVKDSFTPTGE
jgi:hypothetical protein